MNMTKVAANAIFLGVLLMAGTAPAGDVTGKVSETGLKSAGNIAVYIDAGAGKKFDPPAQHVSMDQKNMKFVPDILVIMKGTTVDFLNSDQVVHNVYWPSINDNKALKHSMTIVSPGDKKSYQFDNVGAAPIFCNMHPDMAGYIIIVPSPYFALTGNDGTFTIKNVPAGTYTLKTWAADGKLTTQSITVTDATTNVDLTVVKK
jgi:plastocyanin